MGRHLERVFADADLEKFVPNSELSKLADAHQTAGRFKMDAKRIKGREEVAAWLKELGLSEYLDVLLLNAFEDLETLFEITEEDLIDLGVKKGHIRKILKHTALDKQDQSSEAVASLEEKFNKLNQELKETKVKLEKTVMRLVLTEAEVKSSNKEKSVSTTSEYDRGKDIASKILREEYSKFKVQAELWAGPPPTRELLEPSKQYRFPEDNVVNFHMYQLLESIMKEGM
eukprot:Colp12_sorted_trinity150504_noHs@23738